jgi:hypothetical protein
MAPASEPAQTSSWTWADQYRHIRLSPIISLFPARRPVGGNPTSRASESAGQLLGCMFLIRRFTEWVYSEACTGCSEINAPVLTYFVALQDQIPRSRTIGRYANCIFPIYRLGQFERTQARFGRVEPRHRRRRDCGRKAQRRPKPRAHPYAIRPRSGSFSEWVVDVVRGAYTC